MKYQLDDIEKKKVNYQVPPGYFDELPMRIQQRIEKEKSGSKTIQLPVWSYAVAASLVLLISFIFITNYKVSPSAEELLSEVSEAELIAYLDQMDLDAYDLANAFPEATDEFQFDEIDLLDEVELEDESLDQILMEYNLYNEDLEI